MSTDKFILDFLSWCHANPITVGLVLPVLVGVARRTRNKWDDRVMNRLSKAVGRDDGQN